MRNIILSILLLLPVYAWCQDSSSSAPATTPAVSGSEAKPTASSIVVPDKVPAPVAASKKVPSTSESKTPEVPAVVPTSPAMKPGSPDARFDKTGDGLVDAADWALMTEKEKRAYARASLKALGEDPDAPVGNGKTRLDLYLKGLRAVYQ